MNKDLIMSPSQFKEIRNKLIKYSKGRHTVDSLNNSGFSYEDNLLYTLMNSKTYDNLDILPDETDIDEIRKHYEKVTFFMDFVFGGATTTKDKFYELKQQLINNGVYTKYELNKIGFTYDRYQKFGAEAFFRDIHYKKPGKRGPKPKPKGPYNLSLFPKFKPIKTSEEKQLNIGPGQQLFDIPIKEPTTQIPLDFDQTEVKEKFDAYKELQTAKRRKYTQKSIFDAEPEVVSEEEQLKQKIKIKDEILNRQKKKFPYIDSRKQLGTTVPTYPLQFFDASENDFNNQILDFFNQHLNDERNTKHFSAKMVRFSETGMRIRQTKNEGIDKDLFGVTDVVDKRVMVLLPENQKKKEL